MSNNTQGPQVQTFQAALERYVPQLQAVAAKNINPARLVTLAVDAAMRSPKLLQCEISTIYRGLLYAADLNLNIGGPRAGGYLAPFWVKDRGCYEAVFMASYMGLVDLCYRSGQLDYIAAETIWHDDDFKYELGSNPWFKLVKSEAVRPSRLWPNIDKEGVKLDDPNRYDQIRGFLAHSRIRGSTYTHITWMPKDDVDRRRELSRAAYEQIWMNFYDGWMGRKVPLRENIKLLPWASDDHRLDKVLALDNAYDTGDMGEVHALFKDSVPTLPPGEIIQMPAAAAKREAVTIPAGQIENVLPRDRFYDKIGISAVERTRFQNLCRTANKKYAEVTTMAQTKGVTTPMQLLEFVKTLIPKEEAA